MLEKLNAIVHPAVSYAFEQFKLKNKGAPFVIKEAAILFESGAFKSCDAIILVCAPKEQRIQRVMERDHSTKEAIQARMKHQWSDVKKVEPVVHDLGFHLLYKKQHPILLLVDLSMMY